MSPASLFPAHFKLFYQVGGIPHVQTVPTNVWSGPSGGHPQGTFKNWVDAEIDADDMIQAWAALLQPFFNDQANLDQYIIYNQVDAVAPPLPQTGNVIDLPGTNVSTSWYQAVQQTFMWRDTEFHKFKVVLLDAPTGNVFSKSSSITPATPLADLHDFVTDTAQSISSRFGKRPNTFLSATETLNEKIRRERRLA